MERFTELKQYRRAHRNNFSENLALRSHRGVSWLNRAEMCEDDPDAKFIFLWIAFNEIYAQDWIDQTSLDTNCFIIVCTKEKRCLSDLEKNLRYRA